MEGVRLVHWRGVNGVRNVGQIESSSSVSVALLEFFDVFRVPGGARDAGTNWGGAVAGMKEERVWTAGCDRIPGVGKNGQAEDNDVAPEVFA